MKIPMHIRWQELLWSMRNHDFEWFAMVSDTTSGGVALGAPSTFLQSWNLKISLSSFFLSFTISELGEFRGGGSFSIDDPSSVESTVRRVEDFEVGKNMRCLWQLDHLSSSSSSMLVVIVCDFESEISDIGIHMNHKSIHPHTCCHYFVKELEVYSEVMEYGLGVVKQDSDTCDG